MAAILADSLKSALCRKQEPSFQLWMSGGKVIESLFTHPVIVLVLAVAVGGCLWWGCQRYLRQRMRRLVCLFCAVLCVFALSPAPVLISHWLLVGFLPADSGESVAAIVVLGRGPEQNAVRATTAAALWRAKRAPVILSSGRIDAPKVAELLIKQENIPKSAVVQERCSLSTDENAEFTAAIMMPRALTKIILITDPLHMLRSLFTFKSFGFEVIPYPVLLAEQISDSAADTFSRKDRFLAFRESLGLVSYGLMGRYFARDVGAETIAEADKLVAQQLKRGAATAILQP